MKTITNAANEAIPIRKMNYLIHPPDSDFLKLLVNMYNQLKNLNNWNRYQLYLIRNIQEQIKQENLRLYNETWLRKINKIQNIYNDPKTFWANIRKMMGGTNNNTPYIINNNNEKLYTDREKEGEFQNIWRNIFKISDQENLEFDPNHERIIKDYVNRNEFQLEQYQRADTDRLDPTNYLTRPVTTLDIKIIIKQFKHKAPGKSGINKILLMKLPDVAIDKLKDIFNSTISLGYFPIILKNGLIILILKPGKDPTNPINYRPITLLELPAKILERIINNRFYRFCEENQIFHVNQYGFRKGRGTDIALARINEIIAINQRWKHHCNVVCRDISKAFDKIWHDGLRYKVIKAEALPQIIKKMIGSYISGRTAQIRVKNYIGNKFPLESGVPQGGILSPTLFIFYTSDLPNPGLNCKDVIFADDITQIIENHRNNRDELAGDTEDEIKRINQYERKWKIKTNVSKFNLLSISKSKPALIEVDNRPIPFKNECNILGLKLKRTGITAHITSRISLAKTQTQKLQRFCDLNLNTKLHLYKALIRPLMEYPIVPNALISRSQLMKMQRVQNRNLRLIKRNTNMSDRTIQEIH